jgi:glycosyltransferase A (GT-A) superfamily protein (DUF2064 family)
MDTPQVTTAALVDALTRLAAPGCDAVLGPAFDGGYWTIGLDRKVPTAFDDVPMSTAATFRSQLGRLQLLNLRTTTLGMFRDVDQYDDAIAVADAAPAGHFATTVRQLAGAAR